MRRWWTALLWAAVALQVLLVALGMVFEALVRPASSSGPGFVAGAVVGAAALLSFPAVGALVFWRRPQHTIGWLFCVVNFGWAINSLAGPYARYALVVNPDAIPAGRFAAWIYFWPGPLSFGTLILLLLLFPTGSLLSSRWRLAVWATVAYGVIGAAADAFAPGRIDSSIGFRVDNPLGLGGALGRILGPLTGIAQFLGLLLLVAALLSLALRQRRARGQERQQLKWLTSSLVLYVILVGADTGLLFHYASENAMPAWASLFSNIAIVSVVLIPLSAGIAILKYRLYEIDLLINRALVYTALTASLAAIYAGCVVLLQMAVRSVTGETSQLAVVASTLAIAALFSPLRRWVQGFVDRRFYRRKYDAAKTLAVFGTRLRSETDLEALNNSLVEVIRQTMQPEHVSLWLGSPEASRPAEQRVERATDG